MKILFASAEAYPLAKVGGLGDVAGSLPKALKALGHDVRIVLPRYGMIKDSLEDLARFPVDLGAAGEEAGLRMARIGGVPVYLVDKPDLYDRPKVYEYDDDGKRFGFFCKAILDMLPAADFWHTVSPTYAREIQTAEFRERLDGLLRSRGSKLSGILNGIDYDVWNPAKDSFLTQKYSRSTLERKRSNKTALQKEASLREDAKAPLIGCVSRVTAQKGFDILIDEIGRASCREREYIQVGDE